MGYILFGLIVACFGWAIYYDDKHPEKRPKKTKKDQMGGYEMNNRVKGMLTAKEFEEVLDRRFEKHGSYNRPD